MSRNAKLAALITTGSLLAGGSGYLASTALSQEPGEPTQTVTIQVSGATGPTGPAGPAGPPGPAGASGGASSCPAGSTFTAVEFIQQGEGPTTLLACVKDE